MAPYSVIWHGSEEPYFRWSASSGSRKRVLRDSALAASRLIRSSGVEKDNAL